MPDEVASPSHVVDAEPADQTEAVVRAFNAAFDTRDVEQVAPLLTDDCVFDGTTPPDGDRRVGRDAVLSAFAAVFDGAASGGFTVEEMITSGDRAVTRWRYDWVDHDGGPGHVRGVDVFRVLDGRVSEKLSYVKG